MPRYIDECVYVADVTISNAFLLPVWSSEWIIMPEQVYLTLKTDAFDIFFFYCNTHVVDFKIQTSNINPCSTRFTPRNITANTSFTANDGKIWLEDICKDRLVPLGIWERICQNAFPKAHSCLSCSSIHCLVITAMLHQKYRITAWPSGI